MKVQVYIYDLSMGLAAQLSTIFLGKHIEGVWHTGIVVFGKEYFFGGSGIEYCQPGGTGMGPPHKVHDLGETQIPFDVFKDFLFDLRDKFNPSTYDLFSNNCNSFSNEVAQFLTGGSVPDYIINLPKEVLSTPFGQQLRPMLDRMQQSALSGTNRTLLESPSAPSTIQPSTTQPSTNANTTTKDFASTTTSSGATDTVPLSSSTETKSFPESSVTKIVNNGFTRSEAIEELQIYSGDVDRALISLFGKAVKF